MSPGTSERPGDLVFIGDAHIDRDDADLPDFLALLARLGGTASRIVFMGDLFNLWIGRRELEQPHQAAVVRQLEELRRRGVFVRYLEGNRDYRIGACYEGSAFDEVSEEGIAESFGGHRIFAIHGDLANVADRRYRTWRRLSRSRPVWGLFNLLPRGRRLRWAESLETRLRGSNRAFKREFPEAVVRAYAADFVRSGHEIVVLGHFHVEREMVAGGGRVFVLPEWKSTRRHLRVSAAGDVGFVGSGP